MGEDHGIAGFSLNGLYSPWISLAEAAREFLAAKRLPETLRVWVNTFVGECWEDAGEQIDDYADSEPAGPTLLRGFPTVWSS